MMKNLVYETDDQELFSPESSEFNETWFNVKVYSNQENNFEIWLQSWDVENNKYDESFVQDESCLDQAIEESWKILKGIQNSH
jgi:predicted SAM-dependent methyltransferase